MVQNGPSTHPGDRKLYRKHTPPSKRSLTFVQGLLSEVFTTISHQTTEKLTMARNFLTSDIRTIQIKAKAVRYIHAHIAFVNRVITGSLWKRMIRRRSV